MRVFVAGSTGAVGRSLVPHLLENGHEVVALVRTSQKAIYGRRLGKVEPVFANITRMLGLNRFTLRGKRKVNTQWLPYRLVHNIGKFIAMHRDGVNHDDP
ncbi:MAG: transposase [Gammaproteobacteria bacterium]